MLASQMGSVHCGDHKRSVISALYFGHLELFPEPQEGLRVVSLPAHTPALHFIQGESRSFLICWRIGLPQEIGFCRWGQGAPVLITSAIGLPSVMSALLLTQVNGHCDM